MSIIFKALILFFGTILAFWMSSICGGGASLILIPVLNTLLLPVYVPFSLTVGTFASSGSRIVVFQAHIHWKIVFWFVPFSIPGVILGAWLMKFVDPLYLEVFVAIFLIANLPELFRSKEHQTKEKPYPQYILSTVGLLAGFVSGVTGAIGLLFNKFYLRYGLTKEEIVATRAANEICLHVVKLIVYLLLGLYSEIAIWLGVVIALAATVSSYSVKFILPYLSEYVFRKIGYGAMVVSGFFLLFSTSKSIIVQDNISFSTNKYKETVVNWRNSNFVLEFALDEGPEIERQIQPEELPLTLKRQYDELKHQYDEIFLEKVYRIWDKRGYEFYCYKNGALVKLEFYE